jgi:uncharacterized membrane protein
MRLASPHWQVAAIAARTAQSKVMDAPPTATGRAVADAHVPRPAQPFDAGQMQALIHLYRAEVGRMVAFRQRLDTTTNWSITSVAAVATLALGSVALSQEAFLFLMIVNLFFLVLEARRFKVYEAARFRVLLLEHYFYPEVVTGLDQGWDWRRALVEVLRMPYAYPPISNRGALGWRLRRNYIWIYLVILLTWVVKLQITRGLETNLISAASIGTIPGSAVWAVVVVGYAAMIALALLARHTYPMGSETAPVTLSIDRGQY